MPRILPLLIALAAPALAFDGPPSPREQHEALSREYDAAEVAWDKANPRVTPADPAWIEHYIERPMWSFAPRFVQFAEANPKAPEAVEALLRVVAFVGTGRASDATVYPRLLRARDILAADHALDERVLHACLSAPISGAPGLEPYYRAVMAASRDREMVGRACMALIRCHEVRAGIAARPYFDQPEDDSQYAASTAVLNGRLDPNFIRSIRETDPWALRDEREALLARVVAEFADLSYRPAWVPLKPGAKARTLGDVAGPKLDALRSLAVGKVAPEIAGTDVDGQPMKLSDYRGKVVVLVFWGTWCGPCMRQVPREKALVERLKGRPFALLGINSDRDRDALKASQAEHGITWPSWWDGGKPSGPIATRWAVFAWPSIIVLDAKGVIRHRGLPHHVPKLLDEAVDALLAEIGSK